ncbi:hypothetical protein KSC_107220 [Ktedonobacter sp. SOSP1-52]|uniref:hypothetical protein n=1 Tax=Ktedonobacter sp. SOSP1-52 TaxID=2778366 RepID=UPI001916B36A|nr:hypothetical protein [Ktedonobacter sp. SOSP1-52]GHO71830.1 hypothetical protein KSC_107220 [Ktedonobacter sp. SOSP1-52]
MFYPGNAVVPETLWAEEFLVRPLRAVDVELDYEAVITSRAELLLKSGGRWPREGFTLEENLADLIRHEQEHHDRIAFTYTVMNPAETECLGCLYINPLERLLQRVGIFVEYLPENSAYVTFWVRQSCLVDNLDRRVLQALIPWFQTEWAFSQIVFLAKKVQARQIRLFEEMGMQLQYTLPKSIVYLPQYENTSQNI